MTPKQKEAIRLLRLVKKEFEKLHWKAWNGNAITVGESNRACAVLTYTFGNIEQLIKSPA